MKGIRHEHTEHPSVERLFVTPNYRIATSLVIEYAWAMLEENPAELRRAHKLIRMLSNDRKVDANSSAAVPDDQLLFPGEMRDSFSESLLILQVGGVTAGSAEAKTCESQAKAKAAELLMTDEEKVRGVWTLDHQACMERIKKGASVLSEQGNQTATEDGLLRVGIMLPMSPVRAESIRDEMRNTVGREVVAADVMGCTWTFSRFTDIKELRKWLEERSWDELKEEINMKSEEWGVIPAADQTTLSALCEAMLTSFVNKELRADFRAALESNASDEQVKALLGGWNLEPTIADRADWIVQAVEALDSEKRWRDVEGWVRLYQGRIQGRTRLGLKGLMIREAAKIKQYGLRNSEVLGLYLYTGDYPRYPLLYVNNAIAWAQVRGFCR
jgi:hypothetical protein